MLGLRIEVIHSFTTLPIVATFLESLMTTQTQIAAQITATATAVAKIGAETQTLLTKIADLELAIQNGPAVSPEVVDALAALTAQVAVVDALVPDVVAPVDPVPVE